MAARVATIRATGDPPMAVSRVAAVLIGAACVVTAAAARLIVEQLVLGVLPFLFTFPAAIVAALVGGALAGWIALGGCQLLTLAFVLPHWLRDSGDRPQQLLNLLLATASMALAVWATSSFRSMQLRLRGQCARENRTLSLLVNEIDHRTKNNFQIAAALLHTQGMETRDPLVRGELEAAATRLVSIAAIYGNLSTQGRGGDEVALLAHLGEICDGLRAGLLQPNVTLALGGDEFRVPANTALTIGLVVNEWVTNALKHAFPGRGGAIGVRLSRDVHGLEVEVHDDGVGAAGAPVAGTGSRLLTSLVETLGGRMEVHGGGGTRCVLHAPLPAAA